MHGLSGGNGVQGEGQGMNGAKETRGSTKVQTPRGVTQESSTFVPRDRDRCCLGTQPRARRGGGNAGDRGAEVICLLTLGFNRRVHLLVRINYLQGS